jgi:catechol 2,3-dioxygenase-like lactoylglutathione lyase family enzyme
MKPRVSVLTIGVDDLDRSLRFYRDGLGLHTDGIVAADSEFGAVAFFPLQSGLQLAIWPRRSIAHDSGLVAGTPSPTELTIGHNVSSKPAPVGGRMESKTASGGLTRDTSLERARET